MASAPPSPAPAGQCGLPERQREVRAGHVSLATLVAILRRSYARALIERACGIIVAVDTSPATFATEFEAAEAAIDGTVIMQPSAIAVATALEDRWAELRGAFTEVRLPRDAWADFQAAHDDLQRDPDKSFSISYDLRQQVLVSHQLSPADHAYLTRRASDIRDAINGMTVTATPDLDAFAGYSPAISDPAFSPLALAAATGLPLWCDDVVIRTLACQHGIPVFGTLALLHALIEAGRLPDTLRDDVLNLARGYVTDLMLTPEELLSLAAETQYQPGPVTTIIRRPLFWADPTTAQQVFLE